MAQWKETLEPYVKVVETVKTSTLNPSAGGELIIGCVIISDAGPSVPTLITGQSEFMSTYASADITSKYIGSLDNLYEGADKSLASTMWMNAYRLAGSNTLLCVRASKAKDLFYAKPLSTDGTNVYISRDGNLLRKATMKYALVIDYDGDNTTSAQSGWTVGINGVGSFGNYVSDSGPAYDYYVDNIVDLVNELNSTAEFFSPNYWFGTYNVTADSGKIENITITEKSGLDIDSKAEEKKAANIVVFEELYLNSEPLDDSGMKYSFFTSGVTFSDGKWDAGTVVTTEAFNKNSAFDADKYYAVNAFNSASDLKVRIRRFNHDAVIQKTISSQSTVTTNGESPWVVMGDVLKTFFKADGVTLKDEATRDRDFYEVAVIDPSISSEVLFFNIGKIMGRGDMEASEVNSNLKMIQLVLPDDMADLGLNYYGFNEDNGKNQFEELTNLTEEEKTNAIEITSDDQVLTSGNVYKKDSGKTDKDGSTIYNYYKFLGTIETREQIFADLTIKTSGDDKSAILDVSDSDLKKALDLIALDEVYVTEGLCDLGNTELSFQNYMANMAINENYFYPISTVNSTNYMTIANNASKISQDSYKLYLSAPWDVDSGTLGWKTYMSPSVLYWEAVARNRRNNEEFRGVLGQSGGIVQYQKPLCEFNKKTRQLLLSKKINTVLWNLQTGAWNMNDNFTKQSVENIMSDEGNSRLAIRISKAMPLLLRQFIGRKITASLWEDARGVLNYWFNRNIMTMRYTIGEYMVIIDETNNPKELQKQNKMAVTVNVRYLNSLKYITVYHNILELGMDVTAS